MSTEHNCTREDWAELSGIALKVDGLIAFFALIAFALGGQ